MKKRAMIWSATSGVVLGSLLLGCGGGDTASSTSNTVSTAEYPSG